MSIFITSRNPIVYKLLILHMAQYASYEISFWLHGSGKLPSHSFDCTTKDATIIKRVFTQPVAPNRMGLLL